MPHAWRCACFDGARGSTPAAPGAPPAGDAFAAPPVSALNGAELELVLDAISVAGAAHAALNAALLRRPPAAPAPAAGG